MVGVLVIGLVPGVSARTGPLPDCPPWQLGQYLDTGSRAGVKKMVRDFIDAYNKGDLDRLDEIFAPEPGFEGYWAEPERMWEAGEDRLNLTDYFEERHALRDRLVLTKLRMRAREERGWAFYFELRRSSEQKRARGFYVGKGGADCAMSVWNMGRPA